MKRSSRRMPLAALAAAGFLLFTCTRAIAMEPALPAIGEPDFQAAARASFLLNHPEEFARVNDPTLAVCNQTRDRPSDLETAAILQREQAAIAYPPGGQLLGDWKKGKDWAELTHGGRIGVPGFDDADDPRAANGANCYACHAIDPNFPQAGNMGPPLVDYGKLRGLSPEVVKYTYDKIFNAKSMNPCSLMPRYGGATRLLTPQQVADIVAFLLVPESPVNQERNQ